MLDGIDELVPPGTAINPADNAWVNPALSRSRAGKEHHEIPHSCLCCSWTLAAIAVHCAARAHSPFTGDAG